MEKSNNASAWTEAGYLLFANEGYEGIQVERIARIIGRNKSGFYHYFGDTEGYISQLLLLHKSKASQFLQDIRLITTIDPDYLNAVVKHKMAVLFQLQLIRTKDPVFALVAQDIDNQEDEILRDIWMEYVGFRDNAELALRYFNIVRDMFYTRMGYSMDYAFMHRLMTEAKLLMKQFMNSKHTVHESVYVKT